MSQHYARRNSSMKALVITLALGLLATPALADPCKAIPDKGPMPSYLYRGATFTGPIGYIGDGDSLCVAVTPGPEGLVEVRVADFYAPELHEAGGPQAKAMLEHLAMGRRAVCVADHRTHDRIAAVCRIGGVSVGDLMRSAGIQEGGRGR